MNQRGFVSIIVTIIITALLVGGGVYYYQEAQKDKKIDEAVKELSAKASSEINKLQDRVDELEKETQNQPDVWTMELFDDISGWQTYSDETYSYSIKYPDIYTMENSGGTLVLTRRYPATENNMLGGRHVVEVRVLDGKDNLESYNRLYNWAKGGFIGDDAYYNRQDIDINNNNFVSFDVASGMDTVKEYFLIKDDLVYLIYDSMLGPSDHSINDNIVHSFTFVDDNKSDWQTYTNEEFNFSFRYPSNWNYISEGYRNNKSGYSVIVGASENYSQEDSLGIIVNPDGFGPVFPNKTFLLEKQNGGLIIIGKEDHNGEENVSTDKYQIVAREDYDASSPRFFMTFYNKDMNQAKGDAMAESIIDTFIFLD